MILPEVNALALNTINDSRISAQDRREYTELFTKAENNLQELRNAMEEMIGTGNIEFRGDKKTWTDFRLLFLKPKEQEHFFDSAAHHRAVIKASKARRTSKIFQRVIQSGSKNVCQVTVGMFGENAMAREGNSKTDMEDNKNDIPEAHDQGVEPMNPKLRLLWMLTAAAQRKLDNADGQGLEVIPPPKAKRRAMKAKPASSLMKFHVAMSWIRTLATRWPTSDLSLEDVEIDDDVNEIWEHADLDSVIRFATGTERSS